MVYIGSVNIRLAVILLLIMFYLDTASPVSASVSSSLKLFPIYQKKYESAQDNQVAISLINLLKPHYDSLKAALNKEILSKTQQKQIEDLIKWYEDKALPEARSSIPATRRNPARINFQAQSIGSVGSLETTIKPELFKQYDLTIKPGYKYLMGSAGSTQYSVDNRFNLGAVPVYLLISGFNTSDSSIAYTDFDIGFENNLSFWGITSLPLKTRYRSRASSGAGSAGILSLDTSFRESSRKYSASYRLNTTSGSNGHDLNFALKESAENKLLGHKGIYGSNLRVTLRNAAEGGATYFWNTSGQYRMGSNSWTPKLVINYKPDSRPSTYFVVGNNYNFVELPGFENWLFAMDHRLYPDSQADYSRYYIGRKSSLLYSPTKNINARWGMEHYSYAIPENGYSNVFYEIRYLDRENSGWFGNTNGKLSRSIYSGNRSNWKISWQDSGDFWAFVRMDRNFSVDITLNDRATPTRSNLMQICLSLRTLQEVGDSQISYGVNCNSMTYFNDHTSDRLEVSLTSSYQFMY